MKEGRCPTCGRVFSNPVAPKYTTEEQRQAGRRAAHVERVRRRAEFDASTVLPILPHEFGSRDVGEACRKAGRFWSDGQGVVIRLMRFGYIERGGSLTVDGRGRLIRRWRKVQQPKKRKQAKS